MPSTARHPFALFVSRLIVVSVVPKVLRVLGVLVVLIVLGGSSAWRVEAAGSAGWRVVGTEVVRPDGQPFPIAGVSWYGFETRLSVAHGLWQRTTGSSSIASRRRARTPFPFPSRTTCGFPVCDKP